MPNNKRWKKRLESDLEHASKKCKSVDNLLKCWFNF